MEPRECRLNGLRVGIAYKENKRCTEGCLSFKVLLAHVALEGYFDFKERLVSFVSIEIKQLG